MCNDCIEWGGCTWHIYPGRRESYYERGEKRSGKKRTIRLHRAVYEHHFGPIPEGFDIHHRDGDKRNNSADNLECKPHSEHRAHHRKDEPAPRHEGLVAVAVACGGCGAEVRRKRIAGALCTRCQQRRADEKRTTERACQQCGAAFRSIRGRFCSQRCVNLATNGATTRVLPEGGRGAGILR